MIAPTGPDGKLTAEARRRLLDRAVLRFNEERFHESHEDVEPLWYEAEGARREWLLGLVQVAAAFFHFRRGSPTGFEGLLRSGVEHARGYAGDTEGIDGTTFLADLQPWLAHAERVAKGADLRAGAPPAFPRLRHLPGAPSSPYPDSVEAPAPRLNRGG